MLGVTFGVTLTAVALVGGCGSSSKATGSVGGSCYANGTCNAGLECLSDLCVQPAGGSGGAPGSAGASGQAGAAGGGGQATGAGGGAPGGGAGLGGAGGQSTAGASGSAGAGGAGGACTLIQDDFTGASNDCRTCLTMHCCEKYNACESDSGCLTYIDGGGTLQSAGAELAPLQSCTSTSCPNLCPSAI